INLQGIIGKGKSANEDDSYTIIQVGPSVQRKPPIKTANDIRDGDKVQKINDLKEDTKVRPMTRRQKHKAEKIKKKYGDQDEEERELRLMLLASKPKDTGNSGSLSVYYICYGEEIFIIHKMLL
ncbi:unnamed protein product, partial [Onchocerca flexuosa]|uniref:PDZ domain-containing protein n=1 Tax=Onchocerca flexuosa TaxID=387005 RepID=A0A183HXZ1_9BILA